jgi:hypothetical protein
MQAISRLRPGVFVSSVGLPDESQVRPQAPWRDSRDPQIDCPAVRDPPTLRDRDHMPARITRLPDDVLTLLTTGRGVFMAQDAASIGVTGKRMQHLVQAGFLVRVARGCYASRRHLEQVDDATGLAIKTRGFVRACGPPTLAAGWSAAALRGLPLPFRPPALPSVIQPSPVRRGVSRTPYGLIRLADLAGRHHAVYAGCPVVSTAWMTVDLARTASVDEGLLLADAVLHRGTSRRALRSALADMRRWPGARNAEWIVDHADGRAETPLESLGRLGCLEHGLPVPLSNVWVGDGYPLYRLDHLWPYHWVAAEGDGALKYRGRDPAAVVKAEKEREWALRQLGLEVVRYDWQLAAFHRARLAGRFASALAANPARLKPIQWWPTDNPWIGQDGNLADEYAEWNA